jgi:hypothetical protein
VKEERPQCWRYLSAQAVKVGRRSSSRVTRPTGSWVIIAAERVGWFGVGSPSFTRTPRISNALAVCGLIRV